MKQSRILQAIARRFSDLRTRAFVSSLSAKIEKDLNEVRERYVGSEKVTTDRNSFLKYWSIEMHVARDLERARLLGLTECPKRRILDLGCGMGYFLRVCRHLGHDVYGVDFYDKDIDFCRMFKQVVAAQAIPRIDHRIQPFESLPIPNNWPSFDLITAHQIQFNRLGRGDRAENVREDERWGRSEWEFLLSDFNRIAADSRVEVHLRFNKPDCWEHSYSKDLEQFFLEIGGSSADPTVRLPRGSTLRLSHGQEQSQAGLFATEPRESALA